MTPTIRIAKDIDECAFLWQKFYPVECLFDIWWVREVFARFYSRENYFIIHEDNGKINGLIPLCKIREKRLVSESNSSNESVMITKDGNFPNKISIPNASEKFCFSFFPGEIWHNRTWMEQNKIIAASGDVLREMLISVEIDARQNNAEIDIRYLNLEYLSLKDSKEYPSDFNLTSTEDETGYLFYPKNFGYSYEKYLGAFAGKSRKKILSEIKNLEQQGISFRYNHLDDLKIMFELNISNFGEHCYFYDSRFLQSFIELASLLHKHGMLRVVTVLLNNEIAAVDMGAIWNNTCIMLAGGTNKKFPGIAKLINLHHIEWACLQQIEYVDFLCGDFGWKERFHLTPRPLYQIILR